MQLTRFMALLSSERLCTTIPHYLTALFSRFLN
nr:MAG TPA: hypothetical protein [Caudoviricetes sp.]